MLRKILLGCGILSSPLYLATDAIAALRYERYSYGSQAISELMAEGAPTRPLLVVGFSVYDALMIAFAVGVWMSADRRLTSRLLPLALAAYAITGQAGLLLFPMTPRGTQGALHNVLHGPATVVMSLFVLLAMGLGATVLGRRFRVYSVATIVALLVFGVWAGLDAPQMVAGEPTPWMGIKERINVLATMSWMVVLAISLWQRRADEHASHPGLGAPLLRVRGSGLRRGTLGLRT